MNVANSQSEKLNFDNFLFKVACQACTVQDRTIGIWMRKA